MKLWRASKYFSAILVMVLTLTLSVKALCAPCGMVSSQGTMDCCKSAPQTGAAIKMACCGANDVQNVEPSLTGVTHSKTELTSYIVVSALIERPASSPFFSQSVTEHLGLVAPPFPPALEKTVLRI